MSQFVNVLGVPVAGGETEEEQGFSAETWAHFLGKLQSEIGRCLGPVSLSRP